MRLRSTATAVACFVLVGCTAPLLPVDDSDVSGGGGTVNTAELLQPEIESTAVEPSAERATPTTTTRSSTTITRAVTSNTLRSTSSSVPDQIDLTCSNGRTVHRTGGFVIARSADGVQLASLPDSGNRLQLMVEEWCHTVPVTVDPVVGE